MEENLIKKGIAVAILVLVSFTGVVGFQSVKSSTIAKASPLFSVLGVLIMIKVGFEWIVKNFGKCIYCNRCRYIFTKH